MWSESQLKKSHIVVFFGNSFIFRFVFVSEFVRLACNIGVVLVDFAVRCRHTSFFDDIITQINKSGKKQDNRPKLCVLSNL